MDKKSKLVLIDNYDSFTYNLVHYFNELSCEVEVLRNDAVSVDTLIQRNDIDGFVISPGPCTPNEAGISVELVERAYSSYPILGVCLGHQSIVQAFGGTIIRCEPPMHGKVSTIKVQQVGVFKNLPSFFDVTRYHSLIADPQTLPSCLEVTALADDKVIMAVAHKEYPVFGVQFHPESIASEHGHDVLAGFLEEIAQRQG